METRSIARDVGLPGQRMVFRYDSSGRRTVKRALNWSGSDWSLASEVRFIYQGWNVIAELNGHTPADPGSLPLMRTYA